MASSNVSQFLQTIGQGVKPNMFLIDVQFPQSIALQTEDATLTNILCKSAALPGSNLGVIEVPFRGRTVKIAGDRTFDTWTATFFNDKDFKLRAFFEQWANSINTHEGNTSPLFTPTTLLVTQQILELSNLRRMLPKRVQFSESTNYTIASQLMFLLSILLMIATIRSKNSQLSGSILTSLQKVDQEQAFLVLA